jgi:hypothetical protein
MRETLNANYGEKVELNTVHEIITHLLTCQINTFKKP